MCTLLPAMLIPNLAFGYKISFGINQDLKALLECVVKSLVSGQDNVEIFPKGRGILAQLRSFVR